MSQSDKQPEAAPGFAREPSPAPHVVMPVGAQSYYMPRPSSDKAWLGITSLSVGIAGAFVVTVVALVGDLWAVVVAPAMLLVVSIVAVVFGHLGLSDARKKRTPMGISIAGMVFGYFLTCVFIVILVIAGFVAFVILTWSSGS